MTVTGDLRAGAGGSGARMLSSRPAACRVTATFSAKRASRPANRGAIAPSLSYDSWIGRLSADGQRAVASPDGTFEIHQDCRPSTCSPVDVWLIDPGAVREPLSVLSACLDRDERRRLQMRRDAASGRLFLAAHAGLRRILAGYLAIAPDAVAFQQCTDGGKPELHEAIRSGLHFNLSHTRGLAVVAVTFGRAVGIDVEWVGRRSNALAIARRYFSEAELGHLERAEPHMRVQMFLEMWTRREAVAKLSGKGLLDIFTRNARSENPPPEPYRLYDLALPSVGHVGALAIAP